MGFDAETYLGDLVGSITGTNKRRAFEANQAQQNKVLDLEQQRINALAGLSQNKGLSTGAIVGIVLGVVVVIGLIVWLVTKKS